MSGVDLLALAERVEASAGADRELDGQIHYSLGYSHRTRIKSYTASLDAAMTLVPEGAWWMVEGDSTGGASACVGTPEEVFAKTPALALCSAALRARRQSAAGEG